ncbi:MAG: Asp-tRNA(Asn)/Glu-tRNA(Gln) amidotransferase subunit GatA [Microgenomates group bacterium]
MSDLSKLTVTQSRRKLDAKEFSSVELTTACLDSIKAQEPDLHAFVTVLADDAIEGAKLADRAIANGISKPLLGIPISLKDNFLTKDQRTTASSKVLDHFMPPFNATVVRKLKEAGAVIIGKNNMDAWAHGSSTETSDYGPTHNPWDHSRLPGGSSGGTAAAVSADEVIGGIGSETAGSIRQPASWCGVYGLKPTYGRVSRYGVVAMESSLDSPGPLSKSVSDAALMLGVIAGHDQYDATTPNIPVPDYLGNLNSKVKGLKIGLPKEYFMKETQSGINDMVMQSAKQLEKLGATLVDISLMDPKFGIADYTIIQRAGVSSNLSRYDGVRYGNDRSFFGEEAKRRIMLGSYALSSGYYDAYYKRAQQVRMLLKRDFDRIFSQVDVILSPTAPSTALPIGATLNQSMFGELADLLIEGSSLAGLSAINVPVGLLSGLPVGMQIIANHFEEQKVLNAAYAYEQATSWKENKS